MAWNCGHCSQKPSTRYSRQTYHVLNPSKKQPPRVCRSMTSTAHGENEPGKPTKQRERKSSMAKPNKFNVDMDEFEPPPAAVHERSASHEGKKTVRTGGPMWKGSN